MTTKENPDMHNLPVRRVSIECIDHPEWGTWGVMEDRGGYYEIRGRSGGRVLDKSEAVIHWRVYAPDQAPKPTGPSGITVTRNVEKGGVEIRFPTKPDAAMIDRVKSQGFRWSRFSCCWWAKATDSKVRFACELAGQPVPSAEQAEQVRDPGEDAADRWAELQHGLACNA